MIYDILEELNKENGSNYKISVLKNHSSNELLKRVLRLTYDRVKYTYGLSSKRWNGTDLGDDALNQNHPKIHTLETVLDFMENDLCGRVVTGNEALEKMHSFLKGLPYDEAFIAYLILNRDLKINMGRTQINKAFPDLVSKQLYMRCEIFTKKTAKKINPKCSFVQLKADGTYREFTVENGEISCVSRSGEEYEYPKINEQMKFDNYPDGHYFGELTVIRDGETLNRSLGNGEINSDTPPHDEIILDTWDYVTLEEYALAAKKEKTFTPYEKRFEALSNIVKNSSKIRLIESYRVDSVKEALVYCNKWMTDGLEGAIYKDKDSLFRDGTNPQQQKLKLEIVVDVRIMGFQEGTPGTKREKTFGAILFETDDGMIKGKTSGFTDALLEDFNSRRKELVGTIMAVKCNDVTKGRDNDYYALSHPRFDELRSDKDTTDTLDRALQNKQMAMELSNVN